MDCYHISMERDFFGSDHSPIVLSLCRFSDSTCVLDSLEEREEFQFLDYTIPPDEDGDSLYLLKEPELIVPV